MQTYWLSDLQKLQWYFLEKQRGIKNDECKHVLVSTCIMYYQISIQYKLQKQNISYVLIIFAGSLSY